MRANKLVYAVSPTSFLSNQTTLYSVEETQNGTMDKYIDKMVKQNFTCHVYLYAESFKAEIEVKNFVA